MSEETPKEWAARLAGKMVFHQPTMVVGVLGKFHDEADPWVSKVNRLPVLAEVVEVDGHGLRAIPESFVELSPEDVRFFAAFQQGLSALVTISASAAAKSGVGSENGMALLVGALRAQLAALEVPRP